MPLARAPPCIHDPRSCGRAGRRSHHLIDLLVIFLVLALVVLLVSAPLRARRGEAGESAERAELEAARDAKYREIRDAELDHRTGKLSESDWRALDRTLRAEAIAILRRLDALDPPTSDGDRRSQ